MGIVAPRNRRTCSTCETDMNGGKRGIMGQTKSFPLAALADTYYHRRTKHGTPGALLPGSL